LSGITCLSSFIKFYRLVPNLIGDTQTELSH
jgi:hypothetical protein